MNGQLTTTTARMPRNIKKKPGGKKMSPGALLSKLNKKC